MLHSWVHSIRGEEDPLLYTPRLPRPTSCVCPHSQVFKNGSMLGGVQDTRWTLLHWGMLSMSMHPGCIPLPCPCLARWSGLAILLCFLPPESIGPASAEDLIMPEPCLLSNPVSTMEICAAVDKDKSHSLFLTCPAPSWEWLGDGLLGKETCLVPGHEVVNITIHFSTCSLNVCHIVVRNLTRSLLCLNPEEASLTLRIKLKIFQPGIRDLLWSGSGFQSTFDSWRTLSYDVLFQGHSTFQQSQSSRSCSPF